MNGLQTSYSIVEALEGVREDSSVLDRLVLVRILETEDYETRDKVIRATNKQTNVSAASLRATEDIQRQIELYLVSKQWFYERRKNYYRNRGKPKGRIVQIPFLAQTIMAIGLSRPNDARARPTSLLKSDADYTTVFAEQTPLPVHLWALKVQRIVNNFLQVHMSEPSERTNLRFHLAMLVTARLFGSRVYNPGQLAVLASEDPDIKERDLEDCLVT
ncbi:MAG: AIPR family protein, partial [bacterium]|nr:AIPR family protein [bacterium]